MTPKWPVVLTLTTFFFRSSSVSLDVMVVKLNRTPEILFLVRATAICQEMNR